MHNGDLNKVTDFPRLADPRDPSGYDLDSTRIQSGIQALDEMLENGFWSGSSTLLAGPTGVGKTIMGLRFVHCAVQQREPAVIATMQENPVQLERIVRQFGWSLTGDHVTLMYRSPVDLYLDEWIYDLFEAVEATASTRVLIDSLRDLQVTSLDATRFREYLYSLVQRFSRRGTTLLMTYEVPELVGLTRSAEEGMSHIVDNVVLLQYRNLERMVSRTLTILKTRATAHNPQVMEFEISPAGITLATPPH